MRAFFSDDSLFVVRRGDPQPMLVGYDYNISIDWAGDDVPGVIANVQQMKRNRELGRILDGSHPFSH